MPLWQRQEIQALLRQSKLGNKLAGFAVYVQAGLLEFILKRVLTGVYQCVSKRVLAGIYQCVLESVWADHEFFIQKFYGRAVILQYMSVKALISTPTMTYYQMKYEKARFAK